MTPDLKTKAFLWITPGLLLTATGIGLFIAAIGSHWLQVSLILAGMPIYMWGCGALAEAKGYSTILVLAAFFGVLLPLVILVALPDKNRVSRRRRRSRRKHLEGSNTYRGEQQAEEEVAATDSFEDQHS
ncbi:MAG TPA: hypothetical protein VMF06_03175 [Candidatus Limnocylindria bacterium]|jgi:hypothetical protein|nr:hypothetical protein [Candidatus Limnocylindria bacterium]